MEFFAESATLDTHLQATYKYVNIGEFTKWINLYNAEIFLY